MPDYYLKKGLKIGRVKLSTDPNACLLCMMLMNRTLRFHRWRMWGNGDGLSDCVGPEC